MRFRLIAVVCSLLALVACTGSPTMSTVGGNPTKTPVVTPHGSMSATISGTQWDAQAALLVTQQLGILAVTGTDAFSNFTTVAFAVPATVGTYQVAPLTIANASVDFITAAADAKWTSVSTGSTGTITLATLTATGATGTFAFNLLPLNASATGTKVVTNGVFNVTF